MTGVGVIERCQCTGTVLYDEMHRNVHVAQRGSGGEPIVIGCGLPVLLESTDACTQCGASMKPLPGFLLCIDCDVKRLIAALARISGESEAAQ